MAKSQKIRPGKSKSRKGSILVICSHSDDQIIGVGGAMAKYAKEGYDIHTIVLSFGEGVRPHIRREVITKKRVIEAQKADSIIGGKGVTFLGLKENRFEEDFDRRGIDTKLRNIITEINPIKIFTHAVDDAHPDHRATFRIVLHLHRLMKLSSDLYTFEVWHLLNLKKRNKPKLVVDTSETFDLKIQALKAFKSQIDLSTFYNYLVLNNFLFLLVQIKDKLNGIRNGVKFAEVFYKVR
jgi:N-acetylglucosamine malate deacetylase 1